MAKRCYYCGNKFPNSRIAFRREQDKTMCVQCAKLLTDQDCGCIIHFDQGCKSKRKKKVGRDRNK